MAITQLRMLDLVGAACAYRRALNSIHHWIDNELLDATGARAEVLGELAALLKLHQPSEEHAVTVELEQQHFRKHYRVNEKAAERARNKRQLQRAIEAEAAAGTASKYVTRVQSNRTPGKLEEKPERSFEFDAEEPRIEDSDLTSDKALF